MGKGRLCPLGGPTPGVGQAHEFKWITRCWPVAAPLGPRSISEARGSSRGSKDLKPVLGRVQQPQGQSC